MLLPPPIATMKSTDSCLAKAAARFDDVGRWVLDDLIELNDVQAGGAQQVLGPSDMPRSDNPRIGHDQDAATRHARGPTRLRDRRRRPKTMRVRGLKSKFIGKANSGGRQGGIEQRDEFGILHNDRCHIPRQADKALIQ